GLDASVSLPLAPHWSAEGRLSLLRGYRIASDSAERPAHHDWLPLMPADRFQYGLKWSPGKDGETFIRLLASTTLQQTRIPEAGLLKPAPAGYTTFGLDAAHTFHWKSHPLEVGLNIQNLGNLRYREYLNFFRYYADEPGLNMSLRAKWLFG
ncbi:MAG TPA: TonB-dependent receptor, partial [Saprospiraceae bacterium]|nr:TonB-dependent receptor [Saprospiraceae bacterium]